MHVLTTAQQDRMRHLARRSPAFIGMRIAVHEDSDDFEDLLFTVGLEHGTA